MVRLFGLGGRRGALWAGVTLLAAFLVFLTPDSRGYAAIAKARPADPKELVLRLTDLPLGYQVGDDSDCEAGEAQESATRERNILKALFRWLNRHEPRSCSFEYERLYRTPGQGPNPTLVKTSAMTVITDKAAAEGFALIARFARRVDDESLTEVPAPEAIGNATRLYRSDDVLVEGGGGAGSIVFWRSGHTLATVLVAGNRRAANDRIAFLLAHRQQGRIEDPQPYTDDEFDDSLVPLEDPALHVPVYWLGETFRPGEGLPQSDFEQAFVLTGRWTRGPPGEKLELWYTASPSLGTWTPRGWRRFRRTKFGRQVWSWRCTRSWRIQLPEGHAVIYNGYGRNFKICPKKASRLFFAHVYFERVVVAVDFPSGEFLLKTEPFGGGGPYSSLEGMKAIVRGLHLRPPDLLAETWPSSAP